MAQSDLECANIALTKIGAAKITALADADERAVAANLCLDPLKKSLLRMHPWNFAVARKSISPTFTAITNVTNSGGNFKIHTASTSGLANGDRVTIESIVGCEGANGTWEIEALVANTSFELVNSVFAGAYVSGGQWTEAPAFGYAFSIALPSDWIRTLRVNEFTGEDYRMEGNKILTDSYPVELKYIYNVTDYTLMEVEFYDLLSLWLASQICYRVTQSSTKEAELKDAFRKLSAKYRFDDASEDPAEIVGADDWVNSRLTYGGGVMGEV